MRLSYKLTVIAVSIFALTGTSLPTAGAVIGGLTRCGSKVKRRCVGFVMTAGAMGTDEEGAWAYSGTWETPDGAKVFRMNVPYSSPAGAEGRLEKSLEGAVRIIERGPAVEEKRRVGERAVAVYADGMGGEKVVILRTHKEVFIRIEASAQNLARAFEEFSFE